MRPLHKLTAFGRVVRTTLQEAGCTQSWLAFEIQVTESCLSQWLSGKTVPNDEMIKRIADAIGVNEDVLYLATRQLPPRFDNQVFSERATIRVMGILESDLKKRVVK